MPSISVIIATYNRGQYLDGAIQSLLTQTLDKKDYEIIVMDDGSTDETRSILAKYQSEVEVLHKEHSGLVDTCNRGIEAASGTYVVRVDSDDVVERELLREGKAAMDASPDAVCVYSDRFEHFTDGSRLRRVRKGNMYDLIACGVLMRTEAVRAIGGYRPLFWEEYDLFIRLRGKGRFCYVPKPLYRYRRHDDSMSSDIERCRKGWYELGDLWGWDFLKSLGSHEELEKVADGRA